MSDKCKECGAEKENKLLVVYGCGRAEKDAAFYQQGDTIQCIRNQNAKLEAIVDKLPKHNMYADCYSTREAAEAAEAAKGVTDGERKMHTM